MEYAELQPYATLDLDSAGWQVITATGEYDAVYEHFGDASERVLALPKIMEPMK